MQVRTFRRKLESNPQLSDCKTITLPWVSVDTFSLYWLFPDGLVQPSGSVDVYLLITRSWNRLVNLTVILNLIKSVHLEDLNDRLSLLTPFVVVYICWNVSLPSRCTLKSVNNWSNLTEIKASVGCLCFLWSNSEGPKDKLCFVLN